jgi:hypothetical protein
MTDTLNHSPDRPPRRSFIGRLAGLDDGEVTKWAFRGLLIGTVAVLALDVKALVDEQGGLWRVAAQEQTVVPEPVLPPAVTRNEPLAPSVDPRRHVTVDPARLKDPLRMELRAGGVLALEGTIDLGSGQRFAAEIEQRGEYVQMIELNSPGGSLDDAMAMSNLIRERGYDTHVADGAICASSCPLVMAGGTERTAGAQAAIGLHQFYAGTNAPIAPAQAMSDAQTTTARISRHLEKMNVDPGLWLYALDTPPQALYYLSREEMETYRLVTAPVEQLVSQSR